MSYTPWLDFDFTGETGYTPLTDFDFTGGPTQSYDLYLDQNWALNAAEVNDIVLDQSWALVVPTFADGALNQSWALAAPVFRNAVTDQTWTLAAPVFNAAVMDQSWVLVVPTFADSAFNQTWALRAPVFSDAALDQAWVLIAPMGGMVALDQQWRLEASAVWTRVISSTAYIFALEQGAARDEIPMANFSGQFRSGSPSYLQVSIPDAGTHAATIQAYAALDNVEMVIDAGYLYSDGDYQTQEIARVTLRNIRYDYGSRSSSVSLDGTDTRTNPSPKAVTLTGSSYLNIDTDGRLRYRVRPDFSVRPGDTVTVDGDTFTAGEISWQVNSTSATMEVAG